MGEHAANSKPAELRALRKRRPEAVERWFREHADAVYAFVFHRVGRDRDLATDIVQDTFVAALDRIHKYEPDRGAMRVWLTYTAKNCIRAALRQQKRFRSEIALWEAVDRRLLAAYQDMAAAPIPDEILEKRETAELVQAALAHIPERYQRALEHHYHQRLTLEQIASSEGVTEGAARSLLHRARAAFRTAFLAIVVSVAEQQSRPEAFP